MRGGAGTSQTELWQWEQPRLYKNTPNQILRGDKRQTQNRGAAAPQPWQMLPGLRWDKSLARKCFPKWSHSWVQPVTEQHSFREWVPFLRPQFAKGFQMTGVALSPLMVPCEWSWLRQGRLASVHGTGPRSDIPRRGKSHGGLFLFCKLENSKDPI